MKQGKIWGDTELVFKNDNFEVHRIFVKKGGYCSKHFHRYKHNIFYVELGNLLVKIQKNDYNLVDETNLVSGERMDVKPNETHWFEALDDTIAYEIYYSEPISGDIVREDCGGVNGGKTAV